LTTLLAVLLLASAAAPATSEPLESAAAQVVSDEPELSADAFESRFAAFAARVVALRATDGDPVRLWEAEEIASVAQELWDEGEPAIAGELLQQAMSLLESAQTG
jgi:hypothetical protein